MKCESSTSKADSDNKNVRYTASMLLAAVGDAMGYKNGDWEFNYSSKIIHAQMMEITNGKGPLHLKIGLDWRYSDDTVMHIATAKGIVDCPPNTSLDKIFVNIAKEYKSCWSRMSGRAPGHTTGKSVSILEKDGSNWDQIPYNDRGCGCGGSMRSACLGLVFWNSLEELTATSIEAGRMTHHNPIGYLGSFVASYFTSLAYQDIPPAKWTGYLFEQGFPAAKLYIQKAGREVQENLERGYWQKFEKAWESYCEKRGLSMTIKDEKEPVFPKDYGVIEREHFYKEVAWNGWPGALGIDSVIIAYDALLSSGDSWEQLCLRGILHGGDNDSTGTIAGAWFGALYGLKGVPGNHIDTIEDVNLLKNLAVKMKKWNTERYQNK